MIEEGQVTIASPVKGAGYRMAMVGKWHLGFREAGYGQSLRGGPVGCGFDSFFGLRASTDIPPYFYIRGDRAVAPSLVTSIRGPIVMPAGRSSAMIIRSGDWKLIDGLGSGGFSKPSLIKASPGGPAVQLYNLRADRAEATNLAAQYPDKVKEPIAAMQANVERGSGR